MVNYLYRYSDYWNLSINGLFMIIRSSDINVGYSLGPWSTYHHISYTNTDIQNIYRTIPYNKFCERKEKALALLGEIKW